MSIYKASFDRKARVEFKRFILNPDGSVYKEHPWQKNLIVDSGLNLIANRSFAACFANCKLGDTTNPTQRDSGLTTFTLAGSTLTASAGFFVSGDVGRLFKADSGDEVYITGFTSTTVVTVTPGTAVISASQGTIWYVNDTTLGNQTKNTSNCSNNTGDNGTTLVGNVYTYKRTFLFSAEVGTVSYKEIGWGFDSSTTILGRAVLPATDTLTVGQQYKVIVRLILTVSPNTIQTIADFGNNGFVTAGQAILGDLSVFLESVDTSGATVTTPNLGGFPGEAFVVGQSCAFYLLSGVTLNAFGTAITGTGIGTGTTTADSYVNGTFYRDKRTTYGVSAGNSTVIRGIAIASGFNSGNRFYGLKFTSDQTKDSNHTLEFVARYSWGRTLVN